MKKVYIVLTYTGTILSWIVKNYTKKEYSHVSIALDEDLKEMYSFGRLYPYNPFIGGFVHESTNRGTFKRFYKKIKTKIYSIEVSEEQYERIKEIIEEINSSKEKYHFNFLGLCAVALHLKVKREKYFYCAEFVKYVIDSSLVDTGLPEIIKPHDFMEMKDAEEVYSGMLKEYSFDKLNL